MDIELQLRSHPLFATFTPEALAEAVEAGTAVSYEPGHACMRHGETGEQFGVLISGKLHVLRGHGTAEREHIGSVNPGECFGEMSLLTKNPSSADVVAVEESQAVVFLQEAIGPLIATNPEAIQFLARAMSDRLTPSIGRGTTALPEGLRYSLGASSPQRVLSVSCRAGDMRYRYFDTTCEDARAGGNVDNIGAAEATHTFWGPGGQGQHTITPGTHEAAIEAVFAQLTGSTGMLDEISDLTAVGHRVCHGGLMFDGPQIIDAEAKAEIGRLAALAPMENPFNLKGIEACEELAGHVPQVAVFDTAFHLNMPPSAYRYALPAELATEPELRRFGSHGISHEGAAQAACKFLNADIETLEIVSCHLGTGASLTAIDHGRPVNNTMGMTSLEGLVMATRPGDLDPGLVLHLVCERGIDPRELTRQLYTEAGLLGLSGRSGDVRAVLAAADGGDARALLAVEVYCRRAHKYLSAYIAMLRGADAIIFTGGVGQNAPGIRARICQGLEWLGIRLDETRNRAARVEPGQVADIAQSHSRSRVLIVGSNEEHTIARQTVAALAKKRITNVIRRSRKPIPVSPSAHHVHLAAEHVEALFGSGHTLTWYADLSQSGQFGCTEQVSLLGPKGRIDRVRVLGPVRPETQVEIARTEEFKLGIDAPIRMSGDLAGTPGLTLEGPKGTVVLEQGVICARRHIHMSPQDAMEFAVRDRDVVHVRVAGDRSLVFGDVVVRVSGDYRLDMHIDTDEANAAELNLGATGYIDSIQRRASA